MAAQLKGAAKPAAPPAYRLTVWRRVDAETYAKLVKLAQVSDGR